MVGMDDVVDLEWADAPWWLDAVCTDDMAGSAEEFSAVGEDGPLSPAETLLAASLAGPGPEAMRLLSSLLGQSLTGDERLTALELWQGQLGWVSGAEQTALVDLVGAPVPAQGSAKEFSSLEVAAALHLTPALARKRIAAARLLAGPLKATGDLLRAGELDPYRVDLVSATLKTLPPHAARVVEKQVLPRAATLTGPRLRAALQDAAHAADPDWDIRMFAKARTRRRVGFDFRGQDGLVKMYAFLPPVEAVAMQEHLHKAAKVPSPDPDDTRDLGERMADALVASVLGSTPGDPTTPLAARAA
ncbi:hypothetical protein acdb102_33850 [Acidothermaceae bacterium B102]|nr:hypothetical protein acdb102_33850 [Acidothermaceae bacterium B102]